MTFDAVCSEHVHGLQSAVAQREWKFAASHAHALKGAAAMLGARQIEALARKFLEAPLATLGAAEIEATLAALAASVPRTRSELARAFRDAPDA